MGKKICENCGKKRKISMKQKFQIKIAIDGMKALNAAGIDDKIKEIENFCGDCKIKALKSFVKPFAQALGKAVEDW